ncbi:structural constituent of nuclear pore protein [Ceratobasidium sp. AG-Ba]|nr:structural constituent of nuclear pore protein [Ceratobasidium sp. AG-Ba]
MNRLQLFSAWFNTPGFGVLLRVVADERLRDVLLGIIGGGNGSNRDKCLVRTLQIVSCILKMQDAFIKLLVPAAHSLDIGLDIPMMVPTFDQTLLWCTESVVRLTSLVDYTGDEVPLLSVQLLTALSQSSSFNTMETTTISSRRRLNIDAQEELDADGQYLRPIRSKIVDFLLANTMTTAPAPISRMASGGKELCLHAVLGLLGEGVPGLDRKSRRSSYMDQHLPLFERHPVLAKKCYRLVHQIPSNTRRLFREAVGNNADAPPFHA